MLRVRLVGSNTPRGRGEGEGGGGSGGGGGGGGEESVKKVFVLNELTKKPKEQQTVTTMRVPFKPRSSCSE